jgi:hypothetical protein
MQFCHPQVTRAAKDVNTSQEGLVNLFQCTGSFFKWLYTKVSPTTAIFDIIINVVVEVLTTLVIATCEMQMGEFIPSTLSFLI